MDYKAAFTDERSKEILKESEEQLSLFDLVAVKTNASTCSSARIAEVLALLDAAYMYA